MFVVSFFRWFLSLLFGIELSVELHGIFCCVIPASCEAISCSRRGDEGAPLRPVLGKLRPLGVFDRKAGVLDPSL